MTTSRQREPHGLPTLVISVLMTVLLILGAILMHTLMGHTEHAQAMPGMTAASIIGDSPAAADPAEYGSAASAAAELASARSFLSEGVSDCGGLCAMICSLMGMACLMVLVLFAIAWLRGRSTSTLHTLSKTVAAAPLWACGVIPRRPVSLTALSIIRV